MMFKSRIGAALMMVVLAVAGSACASSNVTQSSAVGTWSVSFDWSGRTSAVLTLVVSPDLTCEQLSGPGVGAATGTVSVSADHVEWHLDDGTTWSGASTSGSSISGTMFSAGSGDSGFFSATQQ